MSVLSVVGWVILCPMQSWINFASFIFKLAMQCWKGKMDLVMFASFYRSLPLQFMKKRKDIF